MSERVCGYCAYMDLSEIASGKFRCEKDGNWRFADDDTAKECYKFCEIFRSKADLADIAIEQSKTYRTAVSTEYASAGLCYITTIVVKILGLEDDCHELEILRWFRSEVMAKNPKYKELLFKYDTLGPMVAKSLKDEDNIDLAIDLFNIYISGAVRYIEEGKFDKAILLYTEMTNELIVSRLNYVCVPENLIEEYNQEIGGHGSFGTK